MGRKVTRTPGPWVDPNIDKIQARADRLGSEYLDREVAAVQKERLSREGEPKGPEQRSKAQARRDWRMRVGVYPTGEEQSILNGLAKRFGVEKARKTRWPTKTRDPELREKALRLLRKTNSAGAWKESERNVARLCGFGEDRKKLRTLLGIGRDATGTIRSLLGMAK